MKTFTARGKLIHHDTVEDRMIIMQDGDTLSLRDEVVEFFCAHGWGTSPGVVTNPPKPGVVKLEAAK